jgi:hypothetical protein
MIKYYEFINNQKYTISHLKILSYGKRILNMDKISLHIVMKFLNEI